MMNNTYSKITINIKYNLVGLLNNKKKSFFYSLKQFKIVKSLT